MPRRQHSELADESILSDGRLLTGAQAAGHLGVCRGSIYHMVKVGVLPYVDIRQKKDGRLPTRGGMRFMIGDLDALILNRRNQLPRWDAMSETLPHIVVMRLLGIRMPGIKCRRQQGTLKGYTPDDIRDSIEQAYRRKFYKEMQATFVTKMRLTNRCPVCKRGKSAKRGTAA